LLLRCEKDGASVPFRFFQKQFDFPAIHDIIGTVMRIFSWLGLFPGAASVRQKDCPMRLGVIADDLAGVADIAGFFANSGLDVIQFMGVPGNGSPAADQANPGLI
jgi:hypothetical protein